MNLAWGRARALSIVDEVAARVEDAANRGQPHIYQARMLGEVASLANHPDALRVAERVLRDAPDDVFRAGVITNLPMGPVTTHDRAIDTSRLDLNYPLDYDALDGARTMKEPHVDLVLASRPEDAWRTARTELAKEEVLDCWALLGDWERVFMYLDQLEARRRDGPLVAVAIESFRCDALDTSQRALDQLRRAKPDPDPLLQIAVGYLGRTPWFGYPFPDY